MISAIELPQFKLGKTFFMFEIRELDSQNYLLLVCSRYFVQLNIKFHFVEILVHL